jgi:prepilin-type N-terminal cleavage/methylation domain-containing protein
MTSKTKRNKGFSLAEVLATIVIGSMIIVGILGIYSRAENSAEAITRRLEKTRLPREVLQKITEDLDSIAGQNQGTNIKIETKTNEYGYQTARLEITKGYFGDNGEKQLLEKIVWQSSYDIESEQDGLVLYRSHTGAASKDALFEQWRAGWEEDFSYIPMCEGVTLFSVQAVEGENTQDEWNSTNLPNGVKITVSFTPPQETLTGEWEVPESEKASRIVSIDKTRKIKFDIFREDEDDEDSEGKQ